MVPIMGTIHWSMSMDPNNPNFQEDAYMHVLFRTPSIYEHYHILVHSTKLMIML